MTRPPEPPLVIGINAGYDAGWPAGLMYLRSLVHALRALPDDLRPRVRLLPLDKTSVAKMADLEQPGWIEMAAPVGPVMDAVLIWRRLIRRFLQPLISATVLPAFKGLDVTYPGFGRPLPGTPQMEWIPDFQHVYLPHLFSNAELVARAERIADIAASRCFVVLSSQAALSDFSALYPQHRAIPRVWRFCSTVVDEVWDENDPRSCLSLPNRYVYVGNQFWAHKDHESIFEALAILEQREIELHLVCTGLMEDPRDPTHVPRLLRMIDATGLSQRVTFLGLVPRPQQIAILRHCAAVVQPSRFEGWSTVVEDAKAFGRPVFLSDIPVHREQLPQGRFFPVGSAEGLADLLARDFADLRPGPDLVSEEKSLECTREARIASGERFLSIAREAVHDYRRTTGEVP